MPTSLSEGQEGAEEEAGEEGDLLEEQQGAEELEAGAEEEEG